MNIPPGVQHLHFWVALAAFAASVLAVSTGCSTTIEDPEFEKKLISDRLDAAARLCLEADIASLPCTDNVPTPEFTPESGVSQFGAHLVDTIREGRPATALTALSFAVMTAGAGGGLGGGRMLATTVNLRDLLLESHARTEVSSIASQIQRKVTRDRLDRCHSMCLVQCFTSGALTYYDHELHGGSRILGSRSDEGPYVAVAEGRGLCRNYVALAQEVGGLIDEDVSSVLTDSGAHRVAGYADSGRAFLIEPQQNPIEAGACNRYPVP